MEESLFSLKEMGGVELHEVIDAYYRCRRRKRRTANAMRFELVWEQECVALWQELNSGTYRPRRSLVFIVDKPTKREVFAAEFRDRVVHHLIAQKIGPLLEARFIDNSYATREGKGTTYGVRSVARQIRAVSRDYQEDCYVMKVDIEGFFMGIDKARLCHEVEQLVDDCYEGNDKALLQRLIRLTVMNRPEQCCHRRSPRRAWDGLSPRKSLFGSDGTRGLPIGNLTSQLLALLWLDPLDHLITGEWQVEGYGRYVDDMVLVDRSCTKLLATRRRIDQWLVARGHRLHPRKFYLQHFRKGVLFVGGMIRPGRILAGHRSLAFATGTLQAYNNRLRQLHGESDDDLTAHFVSSMNSYLGLLSQYQAWNVSHLLIATMLPWWFRYVAVISSGGRMKLVKRRRQGTKEKTEKADGANDRA